MEIEKMFAQLLDLVENGETGVGVAAYLHLIAATQWIHEPGQCILHWQTDDVIEEGPFNPKNNVVAVPEKPGLGVTLSQSRLKRCHERFLKDGAYNYYFDPDAPGKYRRMPLHWMQSPCSRLYSRQKHRNLRSFWSESWGDHLF